MSWFHNPGLTAALQHLEDMGLTRDIDGAEEEAAKREAIVYEMLRKVAENGSATRGLVVSLLKWIDDAFVLFSCHGANAAELEEAATKLFRIVTEWAHPEDLVEIKDVFGDCFGRAIRSGKSR